MTNKAQLMRANIRTIKYLLDHFTGIIQYKSMQGLIHTNKQFSQQGPLLLTWFDFNPSMDKKSHAQ